MNQHKVHVTKGSRNLQFSLFLLLFIISLGVWLLQISENSVISKNTKLNPSISHLSPKFAVETNTPSNTSSGRLIYDSIELFLPDNQQPLDQADWHNYPLEISAYLQKDYIYRFEFETYVPFDPFFNLTGECYSPSAKYYKFFEYQGTLENNASTIHLEYGAAESGIHNFEFAVQTSDPINIHIYINESRSLAEYYQYHPLQTKTINPASIYIADTQVYYSYENSKSLHHNYTIEVEEDQVYWLNLFRVSPVVAQNFNKPTINLNITLDGTCFGYYNDLETLNYGLDSSFGLPGYIFDGNFLLRFGAHKTGTALIQMHFNATMGKNLNFAFFWFYSGEVGNGPDNSTIENTTADANSTISEYGSILEKTWDDFMTFTNNHFDIIVIGLVSILGISWGIGYYKQNVAPKKIKFTPNVEVDKNRGI